MIYGDNPQKINEREDKLGLKTYSYVPQITAVMQSGNLYAYGINCPTAYTDHNGCFINIVTGFLVGGLIGGINAALDGGNFWTGAAIGAATGAASGLFVDIAVATGGVGAVVMVTLGGAGVSAAGNIADQMINDGTSLNEIDIEEVLIEAAVGGVSNLLSFGVSGGSLQKATGSVWNNMKKNAVDTLMEGTTRTVSQKAVKKTAKVVSKKAGKVVVKKAAATVVKKVVKNSAVQLANTAIISGAGALVSKRAKAMLN